MPVVVFAVTENFKKGQILGKDEPLSFDLTVFYLWYVQVETSRER